MLALCGYCGLWAVEARVAFYLGGATTLPRGFLAPHDLVCTMVHTSLIIKDSQIALVCTMVHTNPHFGALLMQP